MKVYRKESHTNKYINWCSNVPKSYITGAMKSLIYRDKELEFLKNTVIANDCPPRLVDGISKKYIPRRHDANYMYDNTKEK